MSKWNTSRWVAGLFVLVCVVIVNELWSLSGGAPAGFTGSYGDGYSTCHTCHYDGPLPTPVSGWITSNIPVSGYVPGNTYTITAQATGIGHVKFGFEVSPMDSFGNLIGTLIPTSTQTALTGSGTYITHTSTGNSGIDGKTWNFDWTAPAPGTGNVTFYGAFNVTNNSFNDMNDTIYTSTYTIQEFSTALVSEMAYVHGVRLFPNPVKDRIQLHFQDHRPGIAEVSIYDLQGKNRMAILEGEQPGTGYCAMTLPEGIGSGAYIMKIAFHGQETCLKFIVQH